MDRAGAERLEASDVGLLSKPYSFAQSQVIGVEVVEVDVELEFVLDDLAAGGADREMDVAAGGAQDFEQANGVDRAASAGDAEDDGERHVWRLLAVSDDVSQTANSG